MDGPTATVVIEVPCHEAGGAGQAGEGQNQGGSGNDEKGADHAGSPGFWGVWDSSAGFSSR